jgi:hypothetical protein
VYPAYPQQITTKPFALMANQPVESVTVNETAVNEA